MKTNNNGKTKRIVTSLIVIIIIIVAIVFRLISNKESIDRELNLVKEFNMTIPVITDTVKNKSISDEFSVNGSFAPFKELSINSETQGKVISIMTDAGKKVNANQILAVTDNKMLESQFETAKLNQEKAKKDLERFEKLNKDDAVSLQQYESAKLNFANAQTAYIAAQKQLENSTIRSPFEGIITKRNIEKGSYLTPGQPAFDIIEINKVKFLARLTEEKAGKVRPGQTVKVSVEANPNMFYDGKINSVIIQADASKKYNVEIEVTNRSDKQIKPGMFGKAIFGGNIEESLIIPRKALTGSIKNPQVFIVQGDSVILRNISTQSQSEKYLTVSKGLKPGDVIVISGQINLKDGSKIKVQ